MCFSSALRLSTRFFSCLKAALAFPIRTLTSASVRPFLSTILPRYVKLSTSSKATSSSKMGAVLAEFIFSILLFPLWMLSPSLLEFFATMLVFSCICCWECDSSAKSSAKSRSSSCPIRSTECHFLSVLWRSSSPNQLLTGTGRVKVGILASLLFSPGTRL